MRTLVLTTALATALVLGPMPSPATADTEFGVAQAHAPTAPARTTKVLVVSLDAMGTSVVRRLGPDRAPTLHRLLDEGAGTLNARTSHELTLTLPNHTGIVTGRRIDAEHGGHGVFWNDERTEPTTVQEAAGHDVSSMFREVDSDARDPGLFVSKDKLSLFRRSWPEGVDRFVAREDNDRLVQLARRDLREHRRALTMVHLSLPDDAGHEHGFSSPEYRDAAARADRLLGRLVATVESRPRLRRHTTVVVTADHGGAGEGHYDVTRPAHFRVPFVVWGAGVAAGTDLYDLNDGYGAERPPVRNGDVANLVTRLLGLGRVPGSEIGYDERLDVS
jgi:predicted AlkP superfamily pyrophosphatase or phosphodiesterase